MKRMLAYSLSAALVAVSVAGCQAQTAPPAKKPEASHSPVIATYDGRTMTAQEFLELSESLPPDMRGSVGAHRREFLDQIIDQHFLEKEARRRGIDRLPDVKETLKMAEGQIIAGKLMETEIEKNAALAPGEAQQYYEAHKSEFMEPMRFRLSQITFATAHEAETVKKELDGGADFAEVANRGSAGDGATHGGDAGYFTKGALIPELEKQALALKVGQLSGVFATEYGFHILKLTDLQEAKPREFKDVESVIEKRLLTQKQADFYKRFMEKIRGDAKVTVDEKTLAAVPLKDEKPGLPIGGGIIRPEAPPKNE